MKLDESGAVLMGIQNREILLQHPIPLYSKAHDLALLWSAKAGCTFAVKWFFFQVGRLNEALSYDAWIHNYRDHFCGAKEYGEEIEGICARETRVVKVVRNPYERAVSSYLMAVRAGYENECLAHFLKRPVNNNEGISFHEFVDYLGTLDLRACDIHHRLQIHSAEEQGFLVVRHLIRLEESFFAIPQCEKEMGLRTSNLAGLRSSEHNTYRKEWIEYWGEVRLYRHLGSRMFPETANFYTDELREKVARLYAIDFDEYGYNVDSIPGMSDRKLLHVDADKLLQNIVDQLPVSGNVAQKAKAEGCWPDSWCSNQVRVGFTVLEPIRGVVVTGCLPGGLLGSNGITLRVNNENSISMMVDNSGDFKISANVFLSSGEEAWISIQSQKSRSGEEAGQSQDSRQLAFFLKEIAFV